ncbi:hypothetical protein ISF_02024 [Cordyceps fumosorosea ARSEF 2679]|uniref:Copper acquisition factor BIM1-like domain-containing protein n=1 Tax=Cordyceps fumosorosea (strain ARSEF 2679) TaxID=1081104 RepID=A0A168CK17_CORFA|nr:hypothetical protein ISF_02024 [Cordyceps fumosorosea ARSEF 2679]OAA71473.1 hypothetical protein ISF_02024 [Cordyceps fumosorosea ARSEF 2679]
MSVLTTLAAAWLMASSGVSAAGTSAKAMTSNTIGPAAFMWPPDRVWSADADNTAPCGSIAGVTNRTTFPLQSGKISLVAQDESYDLELAVSYVEDPKSNSDFNKLIDMETFKDIKLGHTCVTLPNAPSSVKSGTNATLQIKYIADFDKPENQTFYACADITYVELSDFKVSIPCFNATEPSPGDSTSKGGSSSTPSASASASPSSGSGTGKSGLSGGAIAGIVIGSIAGVALIAAAALLIFRRKQQRLRLLRQQNSERGKWAPGGDAARDSQSQGSVRMNNL